MRPEKIEAFIDNKIKTMFSDSNSLDFIIDDLNTKIEKFSNRDTFIDVSKRYLLNNWERINIRKRYNAYYVIYSKKRIRDLKLLKESKLNSKFNQKKIFDLLLFKESIIKKRYSDK
jgi:hypothetical protein